MTDNEEASFSACVDAQAPGAVGLGEACDAGNSSVKDSGFSGDVQDKPEASEGARDGERGGDTASNSTSTSASTPAPTSEATSSTASVTESGAGMSEGTSEGRKADEPHPAGEGEESDLQTTADADAEAVKERGPDEPEREEGPEETILACKEVLTNVNAESSTILQCLGKLEKLEGVTKALLTTTQIGKVVAKLKKHEEAEVAEVAGRIVATWRDCVSQKAGPGKNGGAERVEVAGEEGGEGGERQAKRARVEEEYVANDPVGEDAQYTGQLTKDDKRNKCRLFLFKAFVDGMAESQRRHLERTELDTLVCQIENALYLHWIEKENNAREYNTQLRSIKSNLADKKNPEFNARLYVGALSPQTLATMPSSEMASDAKKRERQKAKKDALEACQSDWDIRNVKRVKGQFPCGKCKSDNTTYFQMQTRSSDEPMTT